MAVCHFRSEHDSNGPVPAAGRRVDGIFPKKRVIVICDIARGAVVFLTGVCMLTGVLRPWHLLIFTFVNSSIEALRIPNGLAIFAGRIVGGFPDC